ncbi:MAG: fibronectin type III domain-containing protein [Treponema sp.]|jgi:hypothetical protein|nr:fibronectin type III domain-containing protein [Treponema sp.]
MNYDYLSSCWKRLPLRRYVFFCGIVFSTLILLACPAETTPDSGNDIPLSGPRSIQITPKDGSLVLQWTKVAPAQGIIPSYDVYYNSTSANSANAEKWPESISSNDSQLVQATLTSLENHRTYYVWVKAVFAGLGASAYSETTYSIPIPPPMTPTSLEVISSEEMLEVRWGDGDEHVLKPKVAVTYEVYYQAGGSGSTPPENAPLVTVSETGAVIPGLTNNTSYTVWVRASNTAGKSTAYVRDTKAPAVQPGVPTMAPGTPTVEAGDGKLTLTWNQVSGVPRYKLYYNTSNNFSSATEFSQIIPANAPTVRADINGLDNTKAYFVWVQSWNSKCVTKDAPYSANITASVQPHPKPAIVWNDLTFELGTATADYIFAQDLAPSVFFPDGRPNTDRLTRVQETALGDLFTDAAAWYIKKKYPEENIDFVFLNGGYIDNALQKGKISTGSLSMITDPDSRNDKFLFLTLTGTQLKAFFDEVADVVHTGRGGPHETGFFGVISKEVQYTIQYYKLPTGTTELSGDAAEPYWHGIMKPGTLKINGEDIVDSQTYRICTTDYVAAGEWYTILYTDGQNKRPIDTPFWHGVAEYIYDQGTITPYLDGRIKVEGGVPLPAPWVPGDRIKD